MDVQVLKGVTYELPKLEQDEVRVRFPYSPQSQYNRVRVGFELLLQDRV
jgi:hypothetical protein